MRKCGVCDLKIRLIVVVIILAFMVACADFFVDSQLVSITVSPPTPSLIVGQTQQFSAIGTYDDNTTKTLGSPTWSTSNASVVLINSAGLGNAVGTGSATITASSGVGVGSTTVTVLESPLTSLSIHPLNPTISIATQNTQQFSAVAVFADGTSRDISNSVTWKSSDTTVATISNLGLATASAKAGTTTISATSGTISASTTLTVVQ